MKTLSMTTKEFGSHVFGKKSRARALYQRLGIVETNIRMVATL